MRKKKIVERAVEFILSRDIEELARLTEEKVAKNIGVNSTYLSRSFKDDRKMAIVNFIQREKIYRAYFILSKDYVKSINELSGELGFLKVEDFDNEFENFFAIKPKAFKDLMKESHCF